jgi:peptidoglycan hydrolase CwlO-like protein
MPDDPAASLIAEKLSHTIDLLRVEQTNTQKELEHYKDLANHRLAELEEARKDFEARIRALQESSTQFKFLMTLGAGGGLLSIIALIKTLISP